MKNKYLIISCLFMVSLFFSLTCTPVTAAVPNDFTNWSDLGEVIPGQVGVNEILVTPDGFVYGGVLTSGSPPYLFEHNLQTGITSSLIQLPGTNVESRQVARDQNGLIYIATSGLATESKLVVYNPFNKQVSDLGLYQDEFTAGMVIGPDGKIYISTCCQGKISIYDPATNAWTFLNPAVSNQRRLGELAVGSDGNIYGVTARIWVSPYGDASLYRLNLNTQPPSVSVIGQIYAGVHEAWTIVNNPVDGKLYLTVGYQMVPRLYAYDPNDPGAGIQFLGSLADGETDVWTSGMTVSADGKVYVSSVPGNHMAVYDPLNPGAGVVDLGVSVGGSRPITFGPDGRLYGMNGTHLVRSEGTAAYTISGFVKDSNNNAVAEVTVSTVNGLYSAITDANGYYSMTGLGPGDYSLIPMKTGFWFSPGILSLQVTQNRPYQNFVATPSTCDSGSPCEAPASEPFLYLPVPYSGDVSTFLMDEDIPGGYLTSWFDHDQPRYVGNGNVTLYDGTVFNKVVTTVLSNGLHCYDRRCYDGHDGLDIKKGNNSALLVYPAASGEVIETCHRDSLNYPEETCSRHSNLGRYVVIAHQDNTYATLYAHLATINDEIIEEGAWVERNSYQSPTPIGLMGGSGGVPINNKYWPVHLHFQVFFNRYGADPWIPIQGDVVDPLGWQPADGRSDPWTSAPSMPLFINAGYASCAPGSIGGSVAIHGVTVEIPAGAVPDGQVVTLVKNPLSVDLSGSVRDIGLSFYIRSLNAAKGNFDQPVQIVADYSTGLNSHIDMSQIALYRKDSVSGAWIEIEAVIDSEAQTISATETQTGEYAVRAPLMCSADISEPIDDYPGIKDSFPGLSPEIVIDRMFDISTDVDWISLEAVEGFTYTVMTDNLATGVDTILTVFASDLETVLATNDNSGGGAGSSVSWTADYTGQHYINVSQATGSAYGCNSTYQVHIRSDALQVFIPLIAR
ncbi:MAG TPA: carboxypeptidase regulatory-like domain-containing protein [Anaerolineaceae bacterium]|nr:carboxypeptidase regulatory-like domain-containing protein [Anaerolineaceae bacterium]HQH85555.1 carboxypeptidase regulatory-like domain-containing protein [Anaerolineaceae bacterium]